MITRDKLRKMMREKRQLIPIEAAQQAAQEMAERILHLPKLEDYQHIALYIANDGEMDTNFLMDQLNALGKYCYLPILDKQQAGCLQFAKYVSTDSLVLNRYGILEPVVSEQNQCSAESLDMVLLPLVAFDKQGHRIGMGKGYYDRTFEFLKKSATPRPALIGLAYECQCVDHIDAEAWDVPLQGVVTEKGSYVF
jgi:5-formyltetrahydrofolate cyclo-ligase